jgi:hypothetical protein
MGSKWVYHELIPGWTVFERLGNVRDQHEEMYLPAVVSYSPTSINGGLSANGVEGLCDASLSLYISGIPVYATGSPI